MPFPSDRVVEVLKEVVSSFPEVKLAYLFGSYAEGRAMPASDIDLALMVENRGVLPHLVAEVSEALNLPEERVSVVEFDRAPPSLLVRVLRRGIKLLDRGSFEQELIRRTKPDFVEVYEECEKTFASWLKGNPLDEEVVSRIVAQVSEDVEDLKELLKRGKEGVFGDRIFRKAFERTLHTAIEGMVDLLRHLVSSLCLGVAEYYRDYVEICREREVISGEVAAELLKLIPTRHSLIHRYGVDDYDRLWEDAERAVRLWKRLEEEVRRYLAGIDIP